MLYHDAKLTLTRAQSRERTRRAAGEVIGRSDWALVKANAKPLPDRVCYPYDNVIMHACHILETNTKSLAKEFSKIRILEYFGFLEDIGNHVIFDADSDSPRMT